MTPKLKHLIGVTAIIIGAVATFDMTITPVIRYLLIFLSLLTMTGIVVFGIYIDVDRSPTLDKIKEKL